MWPYSIPWPGVVRLAFVSWFWMSFNLRAFEPPAADARRAAIGPLDSLSSVLRAALEPDPDFRPIPKPGPDDWLSSHREAPQSFLVRRENISASFLNSPWEGLDRLHKYELS